MAVTQPGANLSLEIRRTYPHPRDKVFAAWIDPQALTRWFAPGDDYTVLVSTLEPRVGGRYVIEMRRKDGHVSRVRGAYRTLERPSRIAFTWEWEEGMKGGETLVTVDFFERGQETELVLTHERFVSVEDRESHTQGWNGCLNRLEPAL